MMITIDQEKCNNCGACIDVCPAMVIEDRNGAVLAVNTEVCISCWHCVAVCPKSAVKSSKFDDSEFKPLESLKPMARKEAVHNLLLTRRSVREFKDKDVPRDILEDMVTVASHAATGHNAQGVKLTVVTDKKFIESLDTRIFKLFSGIIKTTVNPISEGLLNSAGAKSTADTLKGQKDALKRFEAAPGDKGMHIFRGAPVLVVAHHGMDVITGKDDCIIACRDMMLLAEAAGLGCTWIGYILLAARIDPLLKKKLGVPTLNRIGGAFILGWPRRKYKKMIPRKPIKTKWIE